MNKSKHLDVIGNNMKDPFFDSYQEEADTIYDIMNLIDKAGTDFVTLVINKSFLKKIIHSHILHINELERDVKGRTYNH